MALEITDEQRAALANLRNLGVAAETPLRNLAAAGLREAYWRELAESRGAMVEHLRVHIDQLVTGEVPMPNGEFVANPATRKREV
jgi:hypothetical protein